MPNFIKILPVGTALFSIRTGQGLTDRYKGTNICCKKFYKRASIRLHPFLCL